MLGSIQTHESIEPQTVWGTEKFIGGLWDLMNHHFLVRPHPSVRISISCFSCHWVPKVACSPCLHFYPPIKIPVRWVQLREREPVSSQMEEILNSFLDALGEKDPWILEAGAGEKISFRKTPLKELCILGESLRNQKRSVSAA